MNLNLCSWAPAIPTSVCATRLDGAFQAYARDWHNPWNGSTVTLIDKRWLPTDIDLVNCPASASPHSDDPAAPFVENIPRSPSSGTAARSDVGPELAFTGAGTRRLLFAGIGATAAGLLLRQLDRRRIDS